MNNVYRLIWSSTRNAWMVASEITKSRGKRSSKALSRLLPLSALVPVFAFAQAPPPDALPMGGQVVAGQASMAQSGNTLNINQGSQRAAIDWQSFNIGSQATVNFQQPSNTSVALNRVTGGDASQIMGNLNANGQVFITNTSGVLFGRTASVDVGGLVATTHSISNDDFMAGNDHFTRDGATASVVNEGQLSADLNGYIALLAPEVRNEGVIVANMGTVALAAGEAYTLQLDGNRLTGIQVEPATIKALVDNKHAVQAPGGLIILSARAVDSLQGGVVKNSGVLEASSLTERGGVIRLEGDQIELHAGSELNATGATGGGTVLVGGDWQGSGGMHQATTVTMAQGASIDVSATQNGDGGTAVLWSDVRKAGSVTNAHGTILAKGGVTGGDGGRIETSGHFLNVDGVSGSAAAAHGKAGEWLFDPTNVEINNAGDPNAANNGTSTLSASAIAGLLNGGTSVTVTTFSGNVDLGELTVNSAITKSSGSGDVTLTLRAANSVVVNKAITHEGGSGKLNLVLDADNNTASSTSTPERDGAGIVILEANLSTGGGTLTVGGATQNGFTGGDLYVGGGGNAISITTSGGAVDVKGQLIIANSSASGLSVNTADGNITLGGSVDSGNSYTAVGGSWTWAQAVDDADNVANSYLATITSQLENALASRAAGYQPSWLGGRRVIGIGTDAQWRWVTGPEAAADSGNGLVFFNQTGNGTGTTANGLFSNWSANEPNNYNNGSGSTDYTQNNETVLQFTGNNGQWNDYPGQGSPRGETNNEFIQSRYVRETNLAPSKLTLNAGAGNVTINGGVGGNKALSSFAVTAGSTVVNGSSLVTTGGQTYNNALTVTSTGDLQVSATSLSVTNASQAATFKATGNITQKSGMEVTTNGGNVTYWADSDASGNSSTAGGSISIDAGSITTGGGKLVMAGGLDDGANGGTASDGTPAGSAIGAVSSQWGISITGTTLNAGTGDILLRGRSTGTGGGTNIGVRMYSDPAMTVTSGNFTALGFGSAVGTSSSTNNWGVGMEGVNLTASGNVSITGTGGASTTGGGNHGVLLGGIGGTIATTAIDKTITFTGTSGSGSTGDNDGVAINAGYTLGSANTGAISITGTTTSNTGSSEGVAIKNNLRSGASGTAISVNGTSTGNTLGGDGVYANGASLQATGSGGIALTGIAAKTGASGVYATNSNILAASGSIVLNGGTLGIELVGSTVGKKAITLVTSSSSDVTFTGDKVTFTGANTVDTTGKLTVQPYGTRFTSALSWPLANLTLGSLSGLTLGKTGNTANITIGTTTTVAGPISIYGGDITINAGLRATNNSTITLQGTGNVIDGPSGFVDALNLRLLGGNVTLDNTSNAVGYLAASGVGDLTYLDSNTLVINTIDGTAGVSATGVVNIGTLVGNLSLLNDVSTTNTSTTALTLNADINASAGTNTGGNLFIQNNSTVNVGAGGRARLFSGSVADSSLSNLVGSGSNRFRYNSDEATTNYTTTLGAGLYAIYREQPSATVVVDNQTITYGDALTLTGTTSGLVNGDAGVYAITSGLYSTSNNIRASASPYAVTQTNLTGLGYNLTTNTAGTLTVNTKALTLSGFAADATKVYDGTDTAAISNAGSLTGLVGTDVVTAANTGATYDSKNVGMGKTVTLNGISIASTDAANYTIANTATSTANITGKALTLAANRAYNGTTALSAVNISGFVGAETLNFSGATASDAHVATPDKYINAITLANGSNGGEVSNYLLPSLTAAGISNAVSFSAVALTPTISNIGVSKTYDGTTDALSGFTPTYSFNGLVSGDTDASLTNTGAAYNAKHVTTGNLITVSGLALSGIAGSNASQITDYVLSDTSKTVVATITAAPLTITATAVSKTYDGNTSASGTGTVGILAGAGESVNSSGTQTFIDKNVGTGKTVQAAGVTIQDSSNADVTANYAITYLANATSTITRLNSVTWIGGATGNWFDPANWSGGAVPDLSNVANVVIPDGTDVQFGTTLVAPAQAGAVNVDGISGTAGGRGTATALTQSGGTLNVATGGILLTSLSQTDGTLSNAGTTVVDSFNQSGGSFSGTGAMTAGQFIQTGGSSTLADELTVTQGFSQRSSGSVAVGGNAQITDTSGGVQLGNLTSTGTLTVSSTDGAITQATATTITTQNISNLTATQGGNPADITLANATNNFGGALNASGANITLNDINDLTLGNVAASGSLTATSAGALGQASGSVINVTGETALSAVGDITLGGANHFQGSVAAAGQNIALNDVNGLTLGNVSSNGSLAATSAGALNQANGSVIAVTGETVLSAGGDITLGGANDFQGSVAAAGQNIALNDINNLALGNVTAQGNLALNSNGALNLGTSSVSGNLLANSNGGDITQSGILAVGGSAGVSAGTGSVLLANPSNNFAGPVTAQGSSVSLPATSLPIIPPLPAPPAQVLPIIPPLPAPPAQVLPIIPPLPAPPAQVLPIIPPLPAPLAQVLPITPPPPVQPAQALPQAAPPLQQDNLSFGGGLINSGAGLGSVQVFTFQSPSALQSGVINVTVPRDMAQPGGAFKFTLPIEVFDVQRQLGAATVTLVDGQPLPAWLQFDANTGELVAVAVPQGGLPIKLRIAVDGRYSVIEITLQEE